MTSAQLRAARGLVNWSVRDLAEHAGVHRNTITNIETGRYAGDERTVAAIRAALEAAGVRFIDAPDAASGPGVCLERQPI